MLLIFDFDGTIADSLETFIVIANKHFKTSFTKREVRSKGTITLIKELRIPKLLLPLYILRARREVRPIIPLLNTFKDIPMAIRKLGRAHDLAIITTNSKINVYKFLRKQKIESFFAYIDDSLAYEGKDKKITRLINKCGYSKNDCAYIGDESRDIHAAKIAEVTSVAVTWGYESRGLLRNAHPDKIVNSPQELTLLFK